MSWNGGEVLCKLCQMSKQFAMYISSAMVVVGFLAAYCSCCMNLAEVGTNNIISKTQRNKAQLSFQPVKAQRKLRNLFFLISEAQRNFRNELFDSVDAQRNSAIAERHFRTKLKRNLTSAIEISQHRANTALFAIFDRKE